jgi:hypothetical protein
MRIFGFEIEPMGTEFSAENMVQVYFPHLCAGAKVNKKKCRLVKNNDKNIYEIDYAIEIDGKRSAWIDAEHKQHGWGYPKYSVAICTWAYNTGEHDHRTISKKVRVYREFPQASFWMPIRADYKAAGIIVAQDIIDSPVIFRTRPRGMARDIEIYEFESSQMVFGEPYENDIEDYVLEKLEKAGLL